MRLAVRGALRCAFTDDRLRTRDASVSLRRRPRATDPSTARYSPRADGHGDAAGAARRDAAYGRSVHSWATRAGGQGAISSPKVRRTDRTLRARRQYRCLHDREWLRRPDRQYGPARPAQHSEVSASARVAGDWSVPPSSGLRSTELACAGCLLDQNHPGALVRKRFERERIARARPARARPARGSRPRIGWVAHTRVLEEGPPPTAAHRDRTSCRGG